CTRDAFGSGFDFW
nr:immunoglobulin heavy chain junction region [Macaca mulatta]MOV36596.1 immunoglobulin heavy chain junction region [Macaca mulatta]